MNASGTSDVGRGPSDVGRGPSDVGRGLSPPAPTLLTIDGLTCAYGPVVALQDVSISVKPGEVVCVLGVNGAGKTTLLHAIAGMVKPVRGSIVLGERAIAGRRPEEVVKAGAALVPEGRQVFPTMSVRDNLLLGGYRLRRDQKGTRATLDEIHELFPVLERSAGRSAGSRAGGSRIDPGRQRRRVSPQRTRRERQRKYFNIQK